MEIFNVKRRDILDFDNYMDLRKPGFGGPKSAEPYADARGKRVNKAPKLDGYQRTVKRDPLFNHEVYNPTYKAMGGDLVHKQTVGKNPYDYPDSYSRMGIPVVQVGSIKEGRAHSFYQFINEEEEYDFEDESRDLSSNNDTEYSDDSSSLNVDEIERKLKAFE